MKNRTPKKPSAIQHSLLRVVASIGIAMLISALATQATAGDSGGADDVESAELEIVDAALAKAVQDRKPVDRSDTFQVGQKMVAWVTVNNPGATSHVTLNWKKDGQSVWRVDLEAGKSPRWRTWARKTVRAADVGHWNIVVEDPSGNVLQTLEFDVVAANDDQS